MITFCIPSKNNLRYLKSSINSINKNSSQEHCFSNWVKEHCNEQEKQLLLQKYYHQYRNSCQESIQTQIDKGFQVLHLSVHTFNPEENGITHNAAIGVLYDPARHAEKEVARIWNELLIKRTPYRVRLNYPRNGSHDNFTSHLRKRYDQCDYLGLELECNALMLEDPVIYQEFCENLVHSIYSLVELL